MKEIHVKEGPFIKSENRVNNMINSFLISLIPFILFAFYKNGYLPFKSGNTDILGLFYPLIFILISVLVSTVTEYLFNIIVKKEPNKSFIYSLKVTGSVFAGLLLALLLPINTPIWLLLIASLVATVLGKLVWGGIGSNRFNAALVGQLLVIILLAVGVINNSSYFNSAEVAKYKLLPLENMHSINSMGSYDTLVKPYGSLWNFFLGIIPGSLGGTSALMCLVGYLFLIYKKAIKWRIPLIFIGTVLVGTYIVGFLNGEGIWYPVFHVLNGSLLFLAVFIAPDSTTSPATPIGQIIYALALALLTLMFRFLLPFEGGIIIAVLFLNLLTPFLDKIGALARFDLKEASFIIVILIIMILGSSIYIANSKEDVMLNNDQNSVTKDPDFDN